MYYTTMHCESMYCKSLILYTQSQKCHYTLRKIMQWKINEPEQLLHEWVPAGELQGPDTRE